MVPVCSYKNSLHYVTDTPAPYSAALAIRFGFDPAAFALQCGTNPAVPRSCPNSRIALVC